MFVALLLVESRVVVGKTKGGEGKKKLVNFGGEEDNIAASMSQQTRAGGSPS